MPHDAPEMRSFSLPATAPPSRWAALAHLPYSAGGHLGCFRFLAFVNRAALSIHVLVQVFVWTYVSVFLGRIPRSEAAGSPGKSVFNILRKVNHLF